MPTEGIQLTICLYPFWGKDFFYMKYFWEVAFMANVNLSLQVIPVVPDSEIYDIVDKVIKMIESTGLKFVVGPFETSIEGELDELLEIVKEAQTICTDLGAERVVSVVKIDYKKEGVTIDEKVSKYR
jgi:uncharacterized protein (TIGR00106 family)